MANEHILAEPVVHQITEQEIAAAPPVQQRLATPEALRAADQLFAKEQQEQELVSGLLGLYTGTLLLRDLAAEHLARDRNAELEEAKEDEDNEREK